MRHSVRRKHGSMPRGFYARRESFPLTIGAGGRGHGCLPKARYKSPGCAGYRPGVAFARELELQEATADGQPFRQSVPERVGVMLATHNFMLSEDPASSAGCG